VVDRPALIDCHSRRQSRSPRPGGGPGRHDRIGLRFRRFARR
jgi:hypothetical protein